MDEFLVKQILSQENRDFCYAPYNAQGAFLKFFWENSYMA